MTWAGVTASERTQSSFSRALNAGALLTVGPPATLAKDSYLRKARRVT